MHRMKKNLMKAVACASAVSMVSASFSTVAFAKEAEDLSNPIVIEASEEFTEEESIADTEEIAEDATAEDVVEEDVTEEDAATEDEDVSEEVSEEDTSEEDAADDVVEDIVEENATEKNATEENATEVITEEDLSDLVNGSEVKEAVELAIEDGWHQESRSGGSMGWKYYVDGSPLENCVKKIGNNWFGFDWDGFMYDDEFFSLYDPEIGDSVCYCARPDGPLYVKEWVLYKDEEYEINEWYYFGEGGRANTEDCVLTIKGTDYLFWDGGMLATDAHLIIDGDRYVSDEEGHAFLLKKGAWTLVGSDWYYVKADGSVYENCIEKVNNNYYYFSYDGRIYLDDEYSYYDSELEDWVFIRAKSNGVLCVNEWYQDEYGEWYYYGEGGIAPRDTMLELKGVKYLFRYNGGLYENASLIVDNVLYVSDGKGVATAVANEQWTLIDGEWYYAIDGNLLTNCVYEIKGKLYGFNYDGALYQDCMFEIYDYETYTGNYYCARPDGSLYEEEWALVRSGSYSSVFSVSGSDWYYFGADGARVSGFFDYKGNTYLLNPSMVRSCYIVDSEGVLFRADTAGVVKKVENPNGLFYVSDYSSLDPVYYVDGSLVQNEWIQVDNKWFYIGSNGFALCDGAYEVEEGEYYFFNRDGSMACGSWAKGYGDNKYYATADGTLATGELKIDNKWYYFDETGRMFRGSVFYDDKLYLLRPDGSYWMEASEGWNSPESGIWYYVLGGELLREQLVEIEDAWYYFDSNGIMVTDRVYDHRIFAANGKMVTESGWHKLGNDWYYIYPDESEEYLGEVLYDETEEIKGYEYAFDYEGRMIADNVFNGVYYDASGHAVKVDPAKNGWVLSGGQYYYYENGVKVRGRWVGQYYIGDNGRMMTNDVTPDGYFVGADGKYLKNTIYYNIVIKSDGKIAKNEWVKINGKWYYADEDGFNNCFCPLAVINGNLYQFDENGVLIKTLATGVANNTWYKIGNEWTFIRDGQIAFGAFEYNNAWYYIGSDGLMLKNGIGFNVYYGKQYYFGANGKADLTLTGWKDGYYFGEDHSANTGWITVNGKLYHAYSGSGSKNRSEYELIDGVLYKFNKNGSLSNEVYKANGWLKLGDDYYFFVNGKAQTGIVNVSGKLYAFNSDGILVKNCVFLDASSWPEKIYYIGSDGAVERKAGFRTIHGKQMYFNANGEALIGIFRINGKVYYLTDPEYDYAGYDYYKY